ncbi:MAG: hypothetical protein SH818_19035 [Saprospiraceae bacterium]|nr:hypothetical protein [Saprospiraceae bacterium]
MKFFLLFVLIIWGGSCSLEKIDDTIITTLPNFETHFVAEANKTVSVESVVEAIDGGYIISGQMYDVNFFSTIFIIKTSKTGSFEKKITSFGNNFGEILGGKLIRISDGYLIEGSEGGGGASQIFAAKLRPDLTIAWAKTYGIASRDEKGGDLILSSKGELIVAGNNGTFTSNFPFLLRINTDNGNLLDSATITNPIFGRYFPVSMILNGTSIGIMGYNFGISIPIPFFMKIDEMLKPLIAYKRLEDIGGGTGVLVPGAGDGFVIIDGIVTQLKRQAYVTSINGNGDKIGKFDQFPLLAESGFLGGARHTNGKYIACGWGGQTLGVDYFGEVALLTASLSVETTYEFKESNKSIEFTAANSVSDGGYLLAGSYNNAKEIILVKLNNQFKLQ